MFRHGDSYKMRELRYMIIYLEKPDIPDYFLHFHIFRLANLVANSVKNEDAIRLDSSWISYLCPGTWLLGQA